MSRLKNLILTNYRNHESLTLTFGERINLIVGGNAQGKTNILEAIYLLGRGRSFRSKDTKEIIRWGTRSCHIEAELEDPRGTSLVGAVIDGQSKQFRLNGKKGGRPKLPVVSFSPHDIALFTSSPEARRSYLDDLLFVLDKKYKSAAQNFLRLLSHRSRLLKKGLERGFNHVEGEITLWTERLVVEGGEVVLRRKRWVDRISGELPAIYASMGGLGGRAGLEYLCNIVPDRFEKGSIEAAFANRLEEFRDLDRLRGLTHAGPHRDDWRALTGDKEISAYGSQGQRRLMAMTLKIAELRLVHDALQEGPLLLLDDVVSELDEERVLQLIDFVSQLGGQVFITSVDGAHFASRSGPEARVFHLSGGAVTPVFS